MRESVINIVKPAEQLWETPMSPEARLRHVERAARVCYKTEDKIGEGSAEKLLSNVVKRMHFSVLEHGNIIFKASPFAYRWLKQALMRDLRNGRKSFLRLTDSSNMPLMPDFNVVSGDIRAWRDFLNWHYSDPMPGEFIKLMEDNKIFFGNVLEAYWLYNKGTLGNDESACEIFDLSMYSPHFRRYHQMHTIMFTTDRGVTHEIVRHRTLSFSQESTRYCNYSKDKFGKQISVIEPPYCEQGTEFHSTWYVGAVSAAMAYFSMLDHGATAQEARCMLPTCTKADIVVSGHDSDWARFFWLRTAPDVHPQMRVAATHAKELLAQAEPEIFGKGEDDCG